MRHGRNWTVMSLQKKDKVTGVPCKAYMVFRNTAHRPWMEEWNISSGGTHPPTQMSPSLEMELSKVWQGPIFIAYLQKMYFFLMN